MVSQYLLQIIFLYFENFQNNFIQVIVTILENNDSLK